MNEKLRKTITGWLASIVTICASIPVFAVCNPVLADTTYYSYDQFIASTDGNTLYGVNLSINRINVLICNCNTGTNRYYNVAYFLYAEGTSSADAKNKFNSQYGSYTDLLFLRKEGDGSSWNYNNAVSFSKGDFQLDDGTNNKKYIYYAFASINNSPSPVSWLLSVYAKSGVPMCSINDNSYGTGAYIRSYISSEIYNINPNTGASSFAGGWVKDDTAITPVIDMSTITSDGTGSNVPTPTPDSGNGDGENNGSGSTSSSTTSQSQTQYIAEGAIAFTVADGAFSQTQSQTIEENAINVTVNNENGVTQENSQYLNNVINNNMGTEGNAFENAIGNVNGFVSVARSFSSLVGVVLGFLPAWVTTLLSLMFTILFVMIIFRLIHLFV